VVALKDLVVFGQVHRTALGSALVDWIHQPVGRSFIHHYSSTLQFDFLRGSQGVEASVHVGGQRGLHVLSTELNQARRIDRQLYGRCARQGDPGTYVSIYALTDELPTRHLPMFCRRIFLLLLRARPPLAKTICLFGLRRAQAAQERHHRRLRRDLLQMDEQLGKLLSFSGKME